MNIFVGGQSLNSHTKIDVERNSSNPDNYSGFLGAAKKMFLSLAPAPPDAADRSAVPHFKKIKDKNKIEKNRTEDDALRDLDKLIRRIQKSKGCAEGGKKDEIPCKKSDRHNDKSNRGERKRKGGET